MSMFFVSEERVEGVGTILCLTHDEDGGDTISLPLEPDIYYDAMKLDQLMGTNLSKDIEPVPLGNIHIFPISAEELMSLIEP